MKVDYRYPLLLVFSLNLLLFFWMGIMHARIPLNTSIYYNNNHYLQDPRVAGRSFSLVAALGQFDSQWYLKIADRGYPDHPHTPLKLNPKVMDGLLYNFFPLYPLCISFVNLFIRNILISGFVVSNLLLLASVCSLFFVVSEWFSKKVALKTIALFLLFPFSIFLRGYYAESLRILLFIWFCYGLTKKKYFLSAIMVGLLSVTSGISLLLVPFYYGVLLFYRKALSSRKQVLYGIIAAVPLITWMSFCYVHTNDFLIFVKTRSAWERPAFFPFLYNILLIYSFPKLPVWSFYGSRVDVLLIAVTLCLTYLSERVLPKIVWLATIVLAFSPLFVQDSVSFARFSSVLFPFFVYLSVVLKEKYYFFLLFIFFTGLLISSLYFVNWYWIE